MTFKDLKRLLLTSSSQQYEETSLAIEDENPRLTMLLSRLRNTPFWIWDKSEHKWQCALTKGNCCMNHVIGLPEKDGKKMPLFPYEKRRDTPS